MADTRTEAYDDAVADKWYYAGQAVGLRDAAQWLRQKAGEAFAAGHDDRAHVMRGLARELDERAKKPSEVSARADDRIAALTEALAVENLEDAKQADPLQESSPNG